MFKIYQVAALSLLLFIIGSFIPRSSRSESEVSVPESLDPGEDKSLVMIVPAKGVQIYKCSQSKVDAEEYEWELVAPEADLFDENGNKIGKHYYGPHWESNDGSKILGTLEEKADAPSPDDAAWLLVSTESEGAEGELSNITNIQRLNTEGGSAPETGCSRSEVGKLMQIDYTADYYMFGSE